MAAHFINSKHFPQLPNIVSGLFNAAAVTVLHRLAVRLTAEYARRAVARRCANRD